MEYTGATDKQLNLDDLCDIPPQSLAFLTIAPCMDLAERPLRYRHCMDYNGIEGQQLVSACLYGSISGTCLFTG